MVNTHSTAIARNKEQPYFENQISHTKILRILKLRGRYPRHVQRVCGEIHLDLVHLWHLIFLQGRRWVSVKKHAREATIGRGLPWFHNSYCAYGWAKIPRDAFGIATDIVSNHIFKQAGSAVRSCPRSLKPQILQKAILKSQGILRRTFAQILGRQEDVGQPEKRWRYAAPGYNVRTQYILVLDIRSYFSFKRAAIVVVAGAVVNHCYAWVREAGAEISRERNSLQIEGIPSKRGISKTD